MGKHRINAMEKAYGYALLIQWDKKFFIIYIENTRACLCFSKTCSWCLLSNNVLQNNNNELANNDIVCAFKNFFFSCKT